MQDAETAMHQERVGCLRMRSVHPNRRALRSGSAQPPREAPEAGGGAGQQGNGRFKGYRENDLEVGQATWAGGLVRLLPAGLLPSRKAASEGHYRLDALPLGGAGDLEKFALAAQRHAEPCCRVQHLRGRRGGCVDAGDEHTHAPLTAAAACRPRRPAGQPLGLRLCARREPSPGRHRAPVHERRLPQHPLHLGNAPRLLGIQ